MKTNLQSVIRNVVDADKTVKTIFTLSGVVLSILFSFIFLVMVGAYEMTPALSVFGFTSESVVAYGMLVLVVSFGVFMICSSLTSIVGRLMILKDVNILLEAIDEETLKKVVSQADQDVLKKAERHRQLISERGESNPKAAQALQDATERHKELASAFEAVFKKEKESESEREVAAA